jgi:hypothetical protein
MSIPNVEGFWTGELFGTNRGGLTLDIKQEGDRVSGIAKMHEPDLGQYEYTINGAIKEGVSLRLISGRQSGGLNLGIVQAVCRIEEDGSLSGRWKSNIGTERAFTARRFESKKLVPTLPSSNSVFLVHGHDEGAKHSVAEPKGSG